MQFDIHDAIAREVIRSYVDKVRGEGRKIGLASGSFDLLHFHHTLFLTRCRWSCDVLFVGVDSDALVRERKGEGRPIIYDSRRVVMVDLMKPVAFAFIMHRVEDFGDVARLIRPDIIFKNDNFLGKEKEIVGKEYAVRIEIIPDVIDHSSTTAIIGEVARAVAKREAAKPPV